MADMQNRARSNYFAVKDPVAFKAFCTEMRLTVISEKTDDVEEEIVTLYGFLAEEGIPSYHPETDEEVDVVARIGAMLEPGWVAIIQQIYWEQMRYVGGLAMAINGDGESRLVDLHQINEWAKELGTKITDCAY